MSDPTVFIVHAIHALNGAGRAKATVERVGYHGSGAFDIPMSLDEAALLRVGSTYSLMFMPWITPTEAPV
jgi:hypothetical protein